MELLLQQRGRINLTGVRESAQAERLLLLESIATVLAVPALRAAATGNGNVQLLDVGTGGGIPGIPLAITFPHLSVTLLEATRKKVAFLQHALRTLAIESVATLWGRAEEMAHAGTHREQFDIVTIRGVGSLATVAELGLPFCKQGGLLVTYKSLPLAAELQEARHAIQVLGGSEQRVTPFDLPELPARHCLVTIKKTGSTPQRYPRRSGQPARRPLVEP